MTTKTLEKYSMHDGKCHLFQRERSPYWWCGLHHQGKYIRTSTKTTNKSEAERFASKWYFKKLNEIDSGEVINEKITFEKVKNQALIHYKGLVDRNVRSGVTLEGIESILRSRVAPYFDKINIKKIDNTTWHEFKEDILAKYPQSKRGTLHQYKNAIRVVLNEAYRRGYIKVLPVFKDEYKSENNPRPWFNRTEYKKLHIAIREHAEKLKYDRRMYANALELYDYVIFATNTGLRVGELQNLRFSDVRIAVEKVDVKNNKNLENWSWNKKESGWEFLYISNIKGKRGTGTCKSYYGAVSAFERICERRGIKNPNTSNEKLFLVHHRVMFNVILEKLGLKFTNDNPPAKRDFVSLRATYICFRLLSGVPVYEVATNCRTSVEMIEKSYARLLSGRMMQNINRTITIQSWE